MTEFMLHVAGSLNATRVSESHGQDHAQPDKRNPHNDWYDDSDQWADALDDEGR